MKKLRILKTDEKIPTLEEVLKLVGGRVLIDIELKTDVKNFKICKMLSRQLDNYDGPFLVKSFSPLLVAWFRFFKPDYQRGLLVSKLRGVKIPKIVKFLTFNMYFNFLCKPDFIAFDKRDLPNKKIEKLHKDGMPILLWTIKDDDIDFSYDGIIYERKSKTF